MLLDLRHRLEFLILLAFIFIVRLFPLNMARGGLAKFVRILASGTRRDRRALANLAWALPEKSDAERKAIARAMWENIGRVLAETILLDRVLKDRSRMEIENPEIIHRYRGKIGPSIFASLHMGNWEVAVWPMVLAESPVAAVYRLVENPYVDLYLKSQRKELYPEGLFARGSARGFKAGHNTALLIGNYLRNGGRLGMMADLADWKGTPVPFFGHPMWASTVPAMLARRLGVRLWLARCVRIGTDSRFKIAVSEIKVPWTDNPDQDIVSLTAAIQRQFELWIREHPEQWMWSNKRWRDPEFKAANPNID